MENKGTINYLYAALLAMVVIGVFSSKTFADQITINSSFQNITVQEDTEGYATFIGDNVQYMRLTGEPSLPYQVINALLPPQADPSTVTISIDDDQFEALSGTWEVRPTPPAATWDGTDVLVSWPAGVSTATGKNEAVYSTNASFPPTLTSNISNGNIQQWQLIDIPVVLFRYNPVTKKIYRLTNADVVINYETNTRKYVTPLPLDGASKLMGEDRVSRLAVNFNEMVQEYRKHTLPGVSTRAKKSYVIITTSAIASGSTKIAEFITNKEQRGFEVHLVTEAGWGGGVGDTAAENIRNWLIGNYQTLNIEYVLLIGNPDPSTGDVPMKMLWPRNNATRYSTYKESPSDYYYADLTGNWDLDGDGKYGEWGDDFGTGGVDRMYEVIVGRLPYYGNMSDLDSILSKIIAYKNEVDGAWRKKVLLPMEPSDCKTPGYHLGEQIKDNIVVPKGWSYHRIYDDRFYKGCGNIDIPIPDDTETTPCTVNNVTNAWNGSQFGAIFWFTHGWSQGAVDIMDISHVATLNNNYPGFTFQGSCDTACPEAYDNLAYSLLKNGAIATVGATRVSWYMPGQTKFDGRCSNQGLVYEYAKRLITNDMKCGYALHDMKQVLIPGDDGWWMNFTDFCLYGDPETGLSVDANIPVLSVTPTIQQVSETSGVTTFDVANTGTGFMNWTATSNDSWIIIDSGKFGTNSGVISVSYEALPEGKNARTGTITVTADGVSNSPQTVQITQKRDDGDEEGDYVFDTMWPDSPYHYKWPAGLGTDKDGNVYVADWGNHQIQKLSPTGEILLKWVVPAYNSTVTMPNDLAFDSMGNMYITDSSFHHHVQKFSPDRELLLTWGGRGSGDGEFVRLQDIAIDRNHNDYIYIVDRFNHRIQKFNTNGDFITKWGTKGDGDGQFNEPCGIAIDSAGNVYVSERFNHRVQKFTPDGTFIRKWGVEGYFEDYEFIWPIGIAVDENDYVYVIDRAACHCVKKFTSDGVFIERIGGGGGVEDGQLLYASDVVANGFGNIFTLDDRVQKFNTQGDFIARWGGGTGDNEFSTICGIATDSQENVYVVDGGSASVIKKFKSDGTFIKKWSEGEFNAPSGIAIDKQDNIYVVGGYNGRINKYDSDGALIKVWGGNGKDDGQFNSPRGIAVDKNGNVYVADTSILRVQKFTSDGEYITQWGRRGTGDGEFDGLIDLAVDSEGNVYTAESWNGLRIQKFSSDGDFITKWGQWGFGPSEFNGLGGIAIDNKNNVYVSEGGKHIKKFTSNGIFIMQFGELGSDAGFLNGPSYLCVGSSGKIYISETANNRVQVFRPTVGNSTGIFNLGHAISALQVLVGMNADVSGADADGNKKIELNDVIYILQMLAEIKQ